MTLWVILTVMVAIAAAALAFPLARRYDDRAARQDALSVLRQQLAELDSLPEAEAAPLRLELQRRMLAEGATIVVPSRPLATGLRTWLAVGAAAVLAGLSTGLYISLGRPDMAQPTNAAPAAAAPQPGAPGEVAGMIGQLEAKMAANPGDPEGWRMLGWSYFQTRRFSESAEAYRKAAAINPKDATYVSAMGEALVQASGGTVTPAAQAAFEQARALDGSDARSRYFLALLKEQRGDLKGAIADWVALLKEAPADAPWAGELRRIVTEAGQKANIDVASMLPAAPAASVGPVGPATTGVMPSPDPDAVAAAQKMRPGEQQAMIRGMVDGLASRLAQNPKDAQGWLRLMRARTVLGETAQATASYRSAKAAFAGDSATLAQFDAAAKELGIAP